MKTCSGPCDQRLPLTSFWADAGQPDGHMSRCKICERNARAAAAEEKAQTGDVGQPDRNGRLVRFSDEERRRRSERAKRLHAEGRFGGSVIGGRGGRAVNRHRITDAVLDHFRQPEQQEMVIKALERALKGKNKHLGLAAYRELRTTEEKAIERERADRGGAVDPHAMTDDALEEFIVQGIAAIVARGELPDIELGDGAVEEIPTRFVPPSDEEVRKMGAELGRHGQAARAVHDHAQEDAPDVG